MPTTNPFFSTTTGYTGEQGLIDDLVIEQIAIYGVDLMYMPRNNVNLDRLLHESTKDVFELAMSIPMYVRSFDGYDNSIEMLSKFGVRSSDEITLQMSRSQWKTYYAPYMKSYNNAISGQGTMAPNDPLKGYTAERPKEGDLIYFPFDGGIFEIKYVMFDQPFFQLGKGYVYELQCEKFEYSGEDFSTGITEIDTTELKAEFYSLAFQFETGGSGTFDFQEKVTIYDLSIFGETLDEFRLYNDAGYLHGVPTVGAKVLEWDEPKMNLKVSDLTDLDPNQRNKLTDNPSINKFDSVLVIGNTTGASWKSVKATEVEKAFDDSNIIQTEFDSIHVVDVQDMDPFGFL